MKYMRGAMVNFQIQPGCLYDTVAFLLYYFDETKKYDSKNLFFTKIKETLHQAKTIIPQYLLPFAYQYNGQPSFLFSLLLDGSYIDWTITRTTTIFANKQYMRRRFSEYFFDSSDQSQIFKKLTNHPDNIEMIKQRKFEPFIEIYMYYIATHFDEAIQILINTLNFLYPQIDREHNDFLNSSPEFINSLKSENNIEKLKKLAHIKSKIFQASLTLSDESKIFFNDSNPDFILLGSKYESVLDTRYKYIYADPFSFAQAIGNTARYDIYRALINKSPMSRFELEKTLHLSRAALDHNIKIMRETGILIVDHQKGLTNYYKIDNEYIRIVANSILEDIDTGGLIEIHE